MTYVPRSDSHRIEFLRGLDDGPIDGPGGLHPNLAAHDGLGLATDAELAAHADDPNAHHLAPESALVWVALTTVVGGEPFLVWDDELNLVHTQVAP